MRLIILTHYYPPEPGAPQVRLSALAHALAARGASVTVHTCFPHYPEGRIQPPYANRPWSVERDGALRIVRSAVAARPNRGFAPRLIDHASFAVSALATAPVAGRADVVLAESPPLFLAGAAVPYARVRRAALVLNVSDLWPESAIQLGALRNRHAIAAARALERLAYRAARTIVVPTAGIAAALADRPERAGKVEHVPPAVDASAFATAPPRRDGPLRVLYAGTVGLAQGLETLLEAARLAGPETVQVTIAGAGAELAELHARIDRERASNVRFLGPVAAAAVPALYADADAGAVLLRDRPLFEGALPTKMLESMAAGRPVVLSAAGEAARFVERSGGGRVVAPEDPDALAEAFRSLGSMSPERFGELSRAAVGWAVAHDRAAAADRMLTLLSAAHRR